jgi:hypothetical protein
MKGTPAAAKLLSRAVLAVISDPGGEGEGTPFA